MYHVYPVSRITGEGRAFFSGRGGAGCVCVGQGVCVGFPTVLGRKKCVGAYCARARSRVVLR